MLEAVDSFPAWGVHRGVSFRSVIRGIGFVEGTPQGPGLGTSAGRSLHEFLRVITLETQRSYAPAATEARLRTIRARDCADRDRGSL